MRVAQTPTKLILVIVLTLLGFAARSGAQNTIHVPADQPTVQGAINAAQAGDTVLVAPGTYFENIDFQGKAITVTSSDGPAVTIVDGGHLGPVATFKTNEGANSVLNGLTLRNGVPSSAFPISGTSGGGILILLSSPTITNNTITGNHAICGIGMEIQGGSAMVRGNTITGNTQAGGSGGCGGGGIEVTGDSSHPPATPQIIGNTITNNSLLSGGFGGGIMVSYFSSPVIQNNYIAGNSVYNSGGGINLQSYLSPVVVQNIIVNNSTGGGGSGAGINVSESSSAAGVVTNNTIVGNTAFDGSSGIFANVIGTLAISNNIVVAATGQNSIVCVPFRSTFPTFSHNDVISPGTGGQAWSSNCASNAQSNGNISADPQFANAANGDYHLLVGSPAIDSGDNSAPNLPSQDLDGNPRIAFGSATTCSDTVDLGVYEFALTTTPAAQLTPATFDFGAIPVGGTSSPLTSTLSATQGCVAVPTITVSGDYQETNNCTSILGTGSSCSIQVTFVPTSSGSRPGSLLVITGGTTLSAAFSGQGGTAVASLSPVSLAFGNQQVATSSVPQTITLSDSGTLALQISGINISGDFVQTNNCPASLNPGASCSISVTFTPAATGARSGVLAVSSNGGAASASLSGTGTLPIPVFSTTTLNFGNQRVGSTAAAQAITLTNNGNGAFNNSGIAITGAGDFTQTNNCPASLAPGQSCTVNITFAPGSRGAKAATLSVSTSQVASPTVSLSGTGVAPVAVLTSALAFPATVVGTNTTQTATLSNAGDAVLNISSIITSGDFGQANNCPASLPPSAACSIVVTFTPQGAGARNGTLVVADDDPANSQQVSSLAGPGLDYIIQASPASVTVEAGRVAHYSVSVSGLGGTFPNAVGLSCAGLPAGAACSFSPASLAPGAGTATSALSLTTTRSGRYRTPPGTYNVIVNASSGSLVRSAFVTLVVHD
jgi:archaellum component FlaF (FlaF/FlaG flagellin family)